MEMMMMQNHQMHQLVVQQMMLHNLPGGRVNQPPVTYLSEPTVVVSRRHSQYYWYYSTLQLEQTMLLSPFYNDAFVIDMRWFTHSNYNAVISVVVEVPSPTGCPSPSLPDVPTPSTSGPSLRRITSPWTVSQHRDTFFKLMVMIYVQYLMSNLR